MSERAALLPTESQPSSLDSTASDRRPQERKKPTKTKSKKKIAERRDGSAVRLPITYGAAASINASSDDLVSISSASVGSVQGQTEQIDDVSVYVTQATLSRYRYYNRLVPRADTHFLMPDHVVPTKFFYFLPGLPSKGKQSSLITIFSIWNTMMGTSILSIPWAIQQAGFGLGIGLMLFVAGIAFYTAYRVLESVKQLGDEGEAIDFSDVCRKHFGRVGEWLAIIFSLTALLGAMAVYYVLLVNFLYYSVDFMHAHFHPSRSNYTHHTTIYNHTYTDVVCSSMPPFDTDPGHRYPTPQPNVSASHWLLHDNTSHVNQTGTTLYGRMWSQTGTVPAWLLLVVFPLISIKSPTFFTKFNALGTLSIAYLIAFVVTKGVHWGFHMDFTSTDPHTIVPEFRTSFVSLTGIAALAYFIHNAVISLMRNQKNPHNNNRDLFLAYCLVAGTYIGVGCLFYAVFPFAKACIEDNFLNNIRSSDVMAFIGRIALFFQMLTVFPLIVYICRVQVMYALFGKVYPSVLHVTLLHMVLMGFCILFAIFVPHIGTIIRFSGALCGLVLVFTLPCMVHLHTQYEEGTLVWYSVLGHGLIMLMGIGNFAGQFLIMFL